MDIATSHIADADNQQILQLYRYFRRVQVELERLPDDLEKADELRDALNVLAARILQFEASTPMGVLCQMDAAEQFLSEDREEGLFLEVFQTIFQGGKRVMAAYNARQSERQHNRRRRMPRASRFDDALPWRQRPRLGRSSAVTSRSAPRAAYRFPGLSAAIHAREGDSVGDGRSFAPISHCSRREKAR